MKKASKPSKTTKKTSSIPLGLKKLDKALIGLKPGQVMVFGAHPGVGKTAFGLKIIENLALQSKVSVGFFSLELNKQQALVRLACSSAKVDLMQLYLGKGPESAQEKFTKALGEIARAPLEIFATPRMDLLDLEKELTRLKQRNDAKLCIIDHLRLVVPQMVPTPSKKKEDPILKVITGIKNIAKKLQLPILLLDLLPDIPETDKAGKKRALLIEKTLSKSVDVVCSLKPHEVFEEQKGRMLPDLAAEVSLLKNANGAKGKVKLQFLPRYARFEDL
jgi:replicative DNA helicase